MTVQMAFAPDDKLGPYESVAPIGAGGDGQASLAPDTRLDPDLLRVEGLR
jgi:hypothetical protein